MNIAINFHIHATVDGIELAGDEIPTMDELSKLALAGKALEKALNDVVSGLEVSGVRLGKICIEGMGPVVDDATLNSLSEGARPGPEDLAL